MGMNPARHYDQARRTRRQTEQIRQLRKRPHGHAEAKNYVVPGTIDTTVYMPPFFVAIDPDNTIPEVKLGVEFRGVLSAGIADLTWLHNGVPITGSDMTVTTDPGDPDVSQTPDLAQFVIRNRDYFQCEVVAATGATDLTVALFMVTRQA